MEFRSFYEFYILSLFIPSSMLCVGRSTCLPTFFTEVLPTDSGSSVETQEIPAINAQQIFEQ